MIKNLYSLGLLRNGKVYQNKQAAYQGLIQDGTNDGVAKLARYLEPVVGGDPIIRTLVGFYANASEMSDAGGGQSSYTILDIEGNAAEINNIKNQIQNINNIIGNGIDGTTLTNAINDINDRIGTGFSSNYTIADALEDLEDTLTETLTVTIDSTTSALEYIIFQGGVEIGRIKKDNVIESGSVVHGYWSGGTFIEDEEGTDTAIKFILVNGSVIYIDANDLVDVYTPGNGIDINNRVVSIKYNINSEDFLVVDADGIKVQGIQAAIDAVTLEEGKGISIVSKKINAVASEYSTTGIKNPISVEDDGIKFASLLDCGFFDAPVENRIIFADPEVERICVENFSSNGVYLTYEDAANVRYIDDVFKGNTAITSFDEFKYFTKVDTNYTFVGCSNLSAITFSDVTIRIPGVFSGCTNLSKVTMLSEKPPFSGRLSVVDGGYSYYCGVLSRRARNGHVTGERTIVYVQEASFHDYAACNGTSTGNYRDYYLTDDTTIRIFD